MASETDHKHDPERDRKRSLERARWLKSALGAIALLILVVLALATWLLGSESGARMVLSALTTASSGAVRADGIHGKLSGPLMLEHVVLERPNQRVALDGIRLDWEPLALLNAQLHITSLQVERLTVSSKIEQTPEPATLPDSISLPLALQIDKAQINGGEIGWGPVNLIKLSPFAFNLDFDGRRYLLQLNRGGARAAAGADTVSADLSGHVTLGTARPYPLQADFTSGGTAVVQNRAIGANGRIRLDGSLAQFAANVDLALNQARVSGRAVLQPFSDQVLADAALKVESLDLSAFRPDLPHTDLNASLSVAASGAGQLALDNRAAALYSEGGLPLTDMRITFRQSGGVFLFDRVTSTLGTNTQRAGTINGSGQYGNGALTLALTIDALNLRQLDARLQATRLAGKVDIRHASGRQELTVALNEPVGKQNAALTAHATLADARVAIERAELRLGAGRAKASGHVELSGRQAFSVTGDVSRFRLQDLGRFSQFPELNLNGTFSLRGARQPRPVADLAFNINDSQLAGHDLRGDGRAQLRADRVLVPKLLLAAGDNQINMQGELSSGDAQLSFVLAAPRLEQLGPGFAGTLEASGNVRGSFLRPRVSANWSGNGVRMPGQLQADNLLGKAELEIDRTKPLLLNAVTLDVSGRGLKSGSQQLASLSARLQFAPQANAPLAMELRAAGIATPQLEADRFDATVQGTTARHTFSATLVESAQTQNWALGASGGLQQLDRGARWQGVIDRLDASGRFSARLAAPAPLFVSQQRVQLDQFRFNGDSANLVVEQFVRDTRGIATRGRVDRLQLAQVLKFAHPQAPITTDLQLSGAWDVDISDTVKGSISVRRESGDVVMRGGAPVALGLRNLDATATAAGGQLNLRLNAAGQQLGRIELNARADIGSGENRMGLPPNTPLSGTAKIDIPSLAWAGPLVSPTTIIEGRVQSEVTVNGTWAQPRLAGRIGAAGLRLYYGDLGLDLREGILDSEFQGDTLLLKRLAFQGGGGSIAASGPIGFSGAKPSAQIAVKAERFTLLNRSDRRLVVSGSSQLALREGRASVTGAFDVNSGFFDIGREDMPQLSDDVVVVGHSKKGSGALAAEVDVNINLGDGVALRGRGLDALLLGRIHLVGAPSEALRAQGTVQVSQGTFSAYGRKLAIEQGVLRFNGPINNPALDILAMRRGQEVEAGVAVRGTVLAPRVTLVSEPSVPEAEKLSWLVLGRPLDTAGSGDLGALQSAAGALLSQGAASGVQSQIATAFGLDDFRIGTDQDNLQQRIVTLGKRISSRLYVGYEQSLQAAGSVLLLRYTLSPRLTLEAEAGTRSALSLFYNVAFD
jgi:translocation and assembly module TamB